MSEKRKMERLTEAYCRFNQTQFDRIYRKLDDIGEAINDHEGRISATETNMKWIKGIFIKRILIPAILISLGGGTLGGIFIEITRSNHATRSQNSTYQRQNPASDKTQRDIGENNPIGE